MLTPDDRTCWMLLIRHGATANNRAVPPRLQGRRTDPELSPEGRDQATRTARFLENLPISHVFSSPLLRARQTAEHIAGAHGLPVEVLPAITEVDVGIWEGMSWEQVEAQYPEAYRAFMSNAAENPYFDGETMASVRDRVVPAFAELVEQHRGRWIVVVAHNVVNRVYLAHLLDIPIFKYRTIPQDNC
ncbi:MAG: histidine phosphatase family protein, partial [Planctomycetota bacterium]